MYIRKICHMIHLFESGMIFVSFFALKNTSPQIVFILVINAN